MEYSHSTDWKKGLRGTSSMSKRKSAKSCIWRGITPGSRMCSARKDLGVLVDSKWTWITSIPSPLRKVMVFWAALGKVWWQVHGGDPSPLPVRLHLENYESTRETWNSWREPNNGWHRGLRDWCTTSVRKGQESWDRTGGSTKPQCIQVP